MPLDTGDVFGRTGLGEPGAAPDVEQLMRASQPSVGQRLKAAREARGLSLAEVAEATKVRENLLQALEEMRLADLPSRPFAIGYVRAYAEALGLDADGLVVRFRRETPEIDTALKSPLGVAFERHSHAPLVLGGAGAVIAAILLWNVGQRLFFTPPPAAPAAATDPSRKLAELPPPGGVIRVGAPTPAPAEQTVPAPYVTPGLEEAYALAYGLTPPPVTPDGQPAPPPAPDLSLTPAGFTPKGQVFGAEAPRATVILQALKPANIVVRDAAGAIYFARQLAPNDAYRAPSTPGLIAEVSDPSAFAIYRDGQLSGPMTTPAASLDKLAQAAPARSR